MHISREFYNITVMKPGRFLLAIFLLGCSSLFAQNKTVIDSLNKIAGSAKNDSVKVKALIQLSKLEHQQLRQQDVPVLVQS